MKRLIPFFAALMLLTGCSTAESSAKPGYQQISGLEALAIMSQSEDYIILDVRTQTEFEEKHIPGAICIPNESIGSEPPSELPHKDQLIFVYCRSGNRSRQASEKLSSMGYTNIMEFGGINSWPGDTVSGTE